MISDPAVATPFRRRVRRLVLTVGVAASGPLLATGIAAGRLAAEWAFMAALLGIALVAATWAPLLQDALDRWDWLLTTPLVMLVIAVTGGPDSPVRMALSLIAVYGAAFLPTTIYALAGAVAAAAYLAPGLYGSPGPGWLGRTVAELVALAAVVVLVRVLSGRADRLAAEAADRATDLEALFERAPFPMGILDVEGTIVRTNPATTEVLPGASRMHGQRLQDLASDLGADTGPAIAAARSDGGTLDIAIPRRDDDVLLEVTLIPPDPCSERVFVIGRDVTAERRVQQGLIRSGRHQAAIAELGLQALQGASHDELVRRCAALVAEALPADNCAITVPHGDGLRIQTIAGPGAPAWEGRELPREGSLAGHVLATGQPFVSADFRDEQRIDIPRWLREHDTRSGLGVIIHTAEGPWGVLSAADDAPRRWSADDLTLVQSVANVLGASLDRERFERLLREDLEREQRVADELRRVDEMKDNFLAAVSHELRTPLASVLGFALTIERSHERMSDEQLGLLSHRLSTNARRLDALLTDLLDLDRMRRSVLEPSLRETDLADLVERVIDAVPVGRRRLVVDLTPVTARVDAPMIERVVENLLGNALKHTAADRTVWVRLGRRDGTALLTVEDDGPGIPEELHQRVFLPFEQGPHDHPHAPGTGIGLSLVARFTELHGGEAWVTERPGGGASFRVRLPLDPADGR